MPHVADGRFYSWRDCSVVLDPWLTEGDDKRVAIEERREEDRKK